MRANEPLSPHWRDLAECLGMDSSVFFPGRTDPAAFVRARQICASCWVQTECLEDILKVKSDDDLRGCRAGLSPRQRHRIRQQRKRQTTTPMAMATPTTQAPTG